MRRRATLGYTQEDLAAAIQVDARTVRRWEAGVAEPAPFLRPRLAGLLEWSLEDLDQALNDSPPASEALLGAVTLLKPVPVANGKLLTVEYFDASARDALDVATDLLFPEGQMLDINERISIVARDYLELPLVEVVPRIRLLLEEARVVLSHRFATAESGPPDLLLAASRSLGLLANAAMDCGAHRAAHQHADAAASLASAAGHSPTVAWLRGLQASNAYWSGDEIRSARLADDAQALTRDSVVGLYIAGLRARAAGRIGDISRMNEALDAASRMTEQSASDLMMGVFGFSEAKQNLYAASGFLGAGGDERRGLAHAQRAVALYSTDRARGFGDLAGARIDVATAHVRLGDLAAASTALDPVLALPANQRVASVNARLARVAREVAQLPSQPSQQLAERIGEALPRALHF